VFSDLIKTLLATAILTGLNRLRSAR
jgi:hypothetical protein